MSPSMTAILAIAALLSPLSAGVMGVLFFRQKKRMGDVEIVAGEKKIELDEATKNDLIQQAAHRNDQRQREKQTWWQEQITTLRLEIEAERKLSNKRFRRLNRLELWADSHRVWDRKAWLVLNDQYPNFEQPPPLPILDDDEDD